MKLGRDEMNRWVDGYIAAQENYRLGSKRESNHWAVEKFFELEEEHPEVCWEAILQILHREPSQKVLGILAAGPLEDLIEDHGAQFIEEIENEARLNPGFQYLLGGAWECNDRDIWDRVLRARKNKSW